MASGSFLSISEPQRRHCYFPRQVVGLTDVNVSMESFLLPHCCSEPSKGRSARRRSPVRVRSVVSALLPIDTLGSNFFGLVTARAGATRAAVAAAIFAAGRVGVWDSWRRRRSLVGMVPGRGSPSRFARLFGPQLSE